MIDEKTLEKAKHLCGVTSYAYDKAMDRCRQADEARYIAYSHYAEAEEVHAQLAQAMEMKNDETLYKNAVWICEDCGQVEDKEVTFEEQHAGCGGLCVVRNK